MDVVAGCAAFARSVFFRSLDSCAAGEDAEGTRAEDAWGVTGLNTREPRPNKGTSATLSAREPVLETSLWLRWLFCDDEDERESDTIGAV